MRCMFPKKKVTQASNRQPTTKIATISIKNPFHSDTLIYKMLHTEHRGDINVG